MNRSEMAVTVLGLLGTFLLPWPGEGSGVEAAARETAAPIQSVSCIDQPQRCGSAPLRQRSADGRVRVAAAAAGRG